MKTIFYPFFFYLKIYLKQILFHFSWYERKTFIDTINQEWEERINITKSSPDLEKFVLCRNAGKMVSGKLIMHNGIKIYPLSYYNKNYYNLLQQTKGIHEPQEELVFSEILKLIKPNSTMIELGSYWSYYSMWFNKTIIGSKNYMIEPEIAQLLYGKNNFRINRLKGSFFKYYIDNHSSFDKKNPIISIDDFVRMKRIDKISILHSDIQGFELKMLEGAQKSCDNKIIDFVFISTHSNELHEQCIEKLHNYNFNIICSFNLDESFSVDGLIVAHKSEIKLPEEILLNIKSVKKRN
jgi:hypothetical protein